MKTSENWAKDIENKVNIERALNERKKKNILKFGSIAASFVLVCAVAVTALSLRGGGEVTRQPKTGYTVLGADEVGGPVGGNGGCTVHKMLYHEAVIDQTGINDITGVTDKWWNLTSKCEFVLPESERDSFTSILNYIKTFGITRNVYIARMYCCDLLMLEPDLLYSGDDEAISKRLEQNGSQRYDEKVSHAEAVYHELMDMCLEKGLYESNYKSFYDCVTALGLDEEGLKNISDEVKKKGTETFDFNYDFLFGGEAADIAEKLKASPLDAHDVIFGLFCNASESSNRAFYEKLEIISDIGPEKDAFERYVSLGGTDAVYHYVPASLAEYVGIDKFTEWYKTKLAETDVRGGDFSSKVTVKAFVDDFGLTEEEFTENTFFDERAYLNVPLLFDGSAEENEEYYSDLAARTSDETKVKNYRDLNTFIISKYSGAENAAEAQSLGVGWGQLTEASIPELVRLFGLTREQLEEAIESSLIGGYGRAYDLDGISETFDYDLDVCFGNIELEALIGTVSTRERQDYFDALFCRETPKSLYHEIYNVTTKTNRSYCRAHSGSPYHFIPKSVMESCPAEAAEFVKWRSGDFYPGQISDGLCGRQGKYLFNFPRFAREFGITKESFTENATFSELALHDPDIVFSDDDAAVEAYYDNTEYFDITTEKIYNYYLFRQTLADKYGDFDVLGEESIPEFALRTGIDENKLREVAADVADEAEEKYFFEYDFTVTPDGSESRVLTNRFCGLIG